jgi:hypothetical protein
MGAIVLDGREPSREHRDPRGDGLDTLKRLPHARCFHTPRGDWQGRHREKVADPSVCGFGIRCTPHRWGIAQVKVMALVLSVDIPRRTNIDSKKKVC